MLFTINKQSTRSFSLIRTLTVGFGISPNLLTLNQAVQTLAGLTAIKNTVLPPVGNYTLPRELPTFYNNGRRRSRRRNRDKR